MRDYITKSVYGLTGKDGLIAEVIELTNKGKLVCPEATHSAGLGTYVVAWREPVFDPEKAKLLDKPDWEHAKSFKGKEDEKELLIEYAGKYMDLEGKSFDRRKGFDKLLSTFQGYYGVLIRDVNKTQSDN